MRIGIDTGGTFTDRWRHDRTRGCLRRGRVCLPRGPAMVPFLYGPDLKPGFTFQGPALLLEDYSSLLVLPGFQGLVLPQGHILLTR